MTQQVERRQASQGRCTKRAVAEISQAGVVSTRRCRGSAGNRTRAWSVPTAYRPSANLASVENTLATWTSPCPRRRIWLPMSTCRSSPSVKPCLGEDPEPPATGQQRGFPCTGRPRILPDRSPPVRWPPQDRTSTDPVKTGRLMSGTLLPLGQAVTITDSSLSETAWTSLSSPSRATNSSILSVIR